ncbi:MAG TPA: AsmA family protein [Steroidobacteraceae bacterium]|nr:AsmA family protein [Steroidobacteraceae bacterium]
MRTLRMVGIGIAGLVVLLVVLVIAAALLIHPNAYRDRIERTVQRSTGRSLQLSGELHLSLFPSIALRFGPASLGNPPGFPSSGPFLTLRQASLHVKLWPLLHGQLQVGHVDIDGLNAQLLRNAQDRGNWEGFGSGATAAGSPASSAPASAPAALPQIAGLTLRNARVSYEGAVLEPLNLTIGRIAEGVAIPVSLQATMQRVAGPPIALAGSLTLTHAPDGLKVNAIDLHVDQSHLSGSLAVGGAGSETVDFKLQVDRLDLDRYRSAPPKGRAAPATAQTAAPLQLPTTLLKSLQMQGLLLVGSLRLAGITLTQLQLQALARDGVAHLAPLSAQLYGGTFHGNVTIDARGASAVMSTEQSLTNVDLARLLQDFEGTQRLSGRGNLNVMLHGKGADSDALLRSLDGQVLLDVKQGAIEGIDLPFAVEQATALLKHQVPPTGRGSGRTSFQTLHASATVHDGVAETHDLQIATQLLTVRGQGTLNLVSDAVNSQLQIALLKAPAGASATGATLAEVPLNVTGTLASLQVRPDLQQLARSQLQQQLQQQLKKRGVQLPQKVQGALQGLFGGGRSR